IGFTLLRAWPLLKTSKWFRVLFGTSILIFNFILLEFLTPYQGQANIYGVMYHLLYNPLELYPIIPFYTIFIMGTVVGEIIYDINRIENREEREYAIKFRFLYPTFLIGLCLMIFAILFQFPSFFTYSSFSAIVYALGIIFIIVSIVMGIEVYELIKLKKNYNFLEYYSYYSFTIFLAHNVVYFLFYQSLNAISIWFAIVITLTLMTILLRYVYKKLGPKASLKAGISIISFFLTVKLKQRKYVKLGKLEMALNVGKLLKLGNEGKN
ncbi:MAG: hypothetical protein ACFFAO_07775, partial [Candidatus Hermodarchaeota archaeon]